MYYSRILALSFLLAVSACSPTSKTADSDLGPYRTVQNLVQRYGQMTGQFENEYLGYIHARLVHGLPPQEKPVAQAHIILLAAEYPLAGTPGRGYVVLSRGLMRRLKNEGELAFVMAHELSHQILEHRITPDLSSEDYRTFELEADRHAVAMIAAAGYDPRVCVGALLHSAGSGALWEAQPKDLDHPALDERIQATRELVLKSRWAPPGTIDRYDFQKFRRDL